MADVKKNVIVDVKIEEEGSQSLEDLAKDANIAGVSFNSLSKAFGGTTKAIGLMIKSTNLFKIALAATGIGAIVIALGALVTWFTKTQKGADALSDVMAALGAVVDQLISAVLNVGKAFAALLKGDFKGFIDAGADAVNDLTVNMISAVEESIRLERAQRALEEAQRQLNLTLAQNKLRIQELLIVSRDFTVEANKRREAILEANEIEEESIRLQEELARARLFNIQIENARLELQGQLRDEDRENAINAEIDLNNILSAGLSRRRELLNRETTLNNEITRAQEAARKQREQEQKEREQQEFDDFKEREGAFTEIRRRGASERIGIAEQELEAFATTEKLKTQIVKTEGELQEQQATKLMFLKRSIAEEEVELAFVVANNIVAIAGEQSRIGKSLALFTVGLSTIVAIAKTIANTGWPLSIAGVAAVTGQIAGLVGTIRGLTAPSPAIQIRPSIKFGRGGGFDIGGRLHSSGGTSFTGSDGTSFEAERGEKLFVLSRGATQAFNSLSRFNSLFSGNSGGSFLQEGGLVTPGIQAAQIEANSINQVRELAALLPPPQVSVLKILRAAREVEVTNNRGSL